MADQGSGQNSNAPGPPPGPPPPSIDNAEAALGLTVAPAPAQGGGSGTASVENVDLGNTRKRIAYFLLWILVGVIVVIVLVSVVFSVRCWINPDTCTPAATALNILTSNVAPVFTAMVGLVGSVVGFYFGSRQS